MAVSLLLVIVFLFLAGLQVPKLVKNRWWNDLVIYGILWLAAFSLSLAISLGVKIPPVTSLISHYLRAVFGL